MVPDVIINMESGHEIFLRFLFYLIDEYGIISVCYFRRMDLFPIALKIGESQNVRYFFAKIFLRNSFRMVLDKLVDVHYGKTDIEGTVIWVFFHAI